MIAQPPLQTTTPPRKPTPVFAQPVVYRKPALYHGKQTQQQKAVGNKESRDPEVYERGYG
jgi:hypothetical protein